MDDFSLWAELEQFQLNGHKPKKLEQRLIKAAREWLPFRVFWQGGDCLADTPYGTYYWRCAVEIEQERRWDFKEYQEGFAYGRGTLNPRRDDNPYTERARRRSWDWGYIAGLYARKDAP